MTLPEIAAMLADRTLRILTASWLACSLVTFVATGARANPPDVAYDQVEHYFVGVAPPPLGSFEALAGTLGIAPATDAFPPVSGYDVPTSLEGAMRLAMGSSYHVTIFGARTRVEDTATKRVTIGRRDTNEVVYLDAARKTARIVTGDGASALLATDFASLLRAVAPSAAPHVFDGEETFALTAASENVAPATIAGIATVGTSATTSVRTTTATGNCPRISATLHVTQYVDPARRDLVVIDGVPTDPNAITKMLPSTGCRVSFVAPTIPPAVDEHPFVLYKRVDTTIEIPQLPQPIHASLVLQRGHLRPTTAADAAAFEIPADYTTATSPTP